MPTDDPLFVPRIHRFLSPHYDDIALSCGGTAALLSNIFHRVEASLVFGDYFDPSTSLTTLAESLHLQWGFSAAQVIDGRRAEEAAAMTILGMQESFLPFQDALYRDHRYSNGDLLVGPPASDESGLPGKIVEQLYLCESEVMMTRIYAPLAVGGNVDHRISFESARKIADKGWNVWFYEDLPYALIDGAIETRLAEIDCELEPIAVVDIRSTWSRKMDAIMAYTSQLPAVFGDVGLGCTRVEIDHALKQYGLRAGGSIFSERFWSLV